MAFLSRKMKRKEKKTQYDLGAEKREIGKLDKVKKVHKREIQNSESLKELKDCGF